MRPGLFRESRRIARAPKRARHSAFAAGMLFAVTTVSGCSLAVGLDGLDNGRVGGSDADTAAAEAAGPIAIDDAGSAAGDSAGDATTAANAVSRADLLAFYPFDETGGTTAADESGNGRDATLFGGATFAPGLDNNAVTFDGNGQFVGLPSAVIDGTTAFSISTWVFLNRAPTWIRIFDFGSSSTTYMMLTPSSDSRTLRYAITVSGSSNEQRIDAPGLATGSWQNVALTFDGHTGTLYVNGAAVARNANMTLSPASLGTTGHNWLGRSEFSNNPYLDGQIDDFRVYGRTLSAAEVAALATRP